MLDYKKILDDSHYMVRLIDNKIITGKYVDLETYINEDMIELMMPLSTEHQPKHLWDFYEAYFDNLKLDYRQRIDNVEDFYYNKWLTK